MLLPTFRILKFLSHAQKMSTEQSSQPSQDFSYEAKMNDLQEMYENINNMTEDSYDEKTMINSLQIISVLPDFPTEYKKPFATIVFKILTTDAGHIFLKKYKNFTVAVVNKAEEFMNILKETYTPTDEKSAELAKAISIFSLYNETVFLQHGIVHTVYYGYGGEDYEEDYQEEYDDEEYHEDYEEEYQEYVDQAEYEEYEHAYEDDDEDDEYDYEEQLNEEMTEVQRKEARMIQVQKDKMKLVLDQLTRRNDPFYKAALACVKTKQKEWVGWKEESKRHERVIRNILRRELETGNEIENGKYFKCDYELVEQFTECKVEVDINKKFGCDFCVKYDEYLLNVAVIIFDGTIIHEFVILSDMSKLIETLKEEIRKDTAQCLYDTTFFCRDIAGLISAYVC